MKRLRLFDPRWHTTKEDRKVGRVRHRIVVVSDMFDLEDFVAVEQAAADEIWRAFQLFGHPDYMGGIAEMAKFPKRSA